VVFVSVEVEEVLRKRLFELRLRSTSGTSGSKRVKPLELLRSFIGSTVLVKTRGGGEFVGVLESVDSQMNIALAECIELRNRKPIAKHPRVLLRGGNVEYVSLNPKKRTLLDYARVN
jgi:small nuclear ribonucleoprotein